MISLHKVLGWSLTRHNWHYLLGPDRPLRNGLKWAIFILLILVVVHGRGVASAHTEGKMQLAAADAGEFKLTVWTSPDPAKVEDELHVAVAVTLAEDASPVLDADVEVQLTPDSGGQPISARALTEDSENKFLYEAVIDLQESGEYTVVVKVSGRDGSTGEASFDIEVEGSGLSNLVLIGLAIIVLIGALAAIFWLRRANRGDEAASSIAK